MKRPSHLGRGAFVELPIALSDKFLEVIAGHEVLEAKILLALAAEPHDVRKPHVYEVGVRLNAYRLGHAVHNHDIEESTGTREGQNMVCAIRAQNRAAGKVD